MYMHIIACFNTSVCTFKSSYQDDIRKRLDKCENKVMGEFRDDFRNMDRQKIKFSH